MRFLTWLLLASPAVFAWEGLPSLHAPLTIVVDTEAPIAPASLQEMQRELNLLFSQAGRPVEWKLRNEIQLGVTVDDLVLVRFRGRCRMETMPALYDERGPLAFAHTADGEVLPFGEILCDRVKSAARSAMDGRDLKQGDKLMGRAMARVLAHEIWHMTTNNSGHSKAGIARHALTGRQLIADRFTFEKDDIEALRQSSSR